MKKAIGRGIKRGILLSIIVGLFWFWCVLYAGEQIIAWIGG